MADQPFTVNDMNVEDDATFDTDTLVVDGTTNRVGVLVASPTVTFDVLGNSLLTGTLNVTSSLTLGSGGTAYTFPTTDGGSGEALVSDGGGTLSFTAVGAGSVTSVGITPGSGISVSGLSDYHFRINYGNKYRSYFNSSRNKCKYFWSDRSSYNKFDGSVYWHSNLSSNQFRNFRRCYRWTYYGYGNNYWRSVGKWHSRCDNFLKRR